MLKLQDQKVMALLSFVLKMFMSMRYGLIMLVSQYELALVFGLST